MELIYLGIGAIVFWYLWWGVREDLEIMLSYYAAKLGLGESNMYYPSLVVLCFVVYVFYGWIFFR